MVKYPFSIMDCTMYEVPFRVTRKLGEHSPLKRLAANATRDDRPRLAVLELAVLRNVLLQAHEPEAGHAQAEQKRVHNTKSKNRMIAPITKAPPHPNASIHGMTAARLSSDDLPVRYATIPTSKNTITPLAVAAKYIGHQDIIRRSPSLFC